MVRSSTVADAGKPLQIGEVAELTGLSLRTLRHYDEIGLCSPSSRSDGGFRLYAADDVERLMVIRRMKPLGYSLDDMHRVMDLLRAEHVEESTWAELLAEATDRRASLAEKVRMADEFVALLRSHAT